MESHNAEAGDNSSWVSPCAKPSLPLCVRLSKAIAHDPSSSASDADRFAQLYKRLQEKIEESGDQLEQGAKQSELSATQKGARATHIILLICGTSLLMLFLGVMMSGFTFIGIDAYVQDIVKGIIIVVAVVADQYRQRRRKKA